jgi:tetratricopeptide (TPR) repeat protein
MKPYTSRTRLLLAISALALAACGSKEGRIESGLKKGADFVQATDWDKANVEVRNVLQIDPKNARAYLIAAQASEGQKELPKAYAQYGKALELKPDLLDAKLGQARLLLVTGDTARAEVLVKDVLTVDGKNPLARTLQAALMAREGKPDKALALAKAIAAENSNVPTDTSLLLAGLYANAKDWPQATAVIDKALTAEPRHLGLIQAAVEMVASNPQDVQLAAKATDFFKRAVNASPKSNDLWLAWARYHLGRKEVDAAEQVLRDAIKAQPDDGKRTLALLEFLGAARSPEIAEKQHLASISDKPRDMALRFSLVNLYRSTNRNGDAQKVLKEVVDLNSDSASTVNARDQLAALYLAAGKTDDARAQLAEVLKVNPRDNAALMLRGRMQLQANAPREAVADFRAVLRDQPTSPEVLQLLAQAHRAAGEPQLAREVLAEAVNSRPEDVNLRVMLAADMADAKEFKSAFAELDSAIRTQPKLQRLYELKAQMAMATKGFALAQQTMADLKAARPGETLPYVRLGQIFAAQGRNDLALKEYDAGAAAVPADDTPFMAGVSLLTGLKRYDEANARIQARTKAEGSNVLLGEQLSMEVALAKRDFVQAEKSARNLIAAAPQQAGSYMSLAKVMGAKGDPAGAVLALSEGEKDIPAERSLPMARAEWLTRMKRYDDAIVLYDQLRTRFPDDDLVLNNLAYLLAEVKGDKASTERALSLSGRLAESRNPAHLDSLGWIHYQLGQYDKAVPLLERAVALAPPSPLLQLHLGQALLKSGDAVRGKELIKRAIDSKANLPRLDEARALLAQG